MSALPLTNFISQSSARKRTYKTLTVQFGDGYQQDAPNGINNIIDEWSIVYDNLSTTDRATLVSFLDSVGAWTSFTWQALGDSTTKNWKVTKDGWSETVKAGSVYSISFSIKQIY